MDEVPTSPTTEFKTNDWPSDEPAERDALWRQQCASVFPCTSSMVMKCLSPDSSTECTVTES